MRDLAKLIEANEPYLMRRVLEYARLHNYTKYTSTLEEAWRVSIAGLSDALIKALRTDGRIPELNVDEDYSRDRIAAFGIIEARLHRDRGITLEMFLGLMKYYRQAYLDLILEANLDRETEQQQASLIYQFFDRIEVAFCSEWYRESNEIIYQKMQEANRFMTNEKNKYLTIFESIPTPVIIVDVDNMIDNMNKAATELIRDAGSTGTSYYSGNRSMNNIAQVMPWLLEEFDTFMNGNEIHKSIQKDQKFSGNEIRQLVIQFHRMLDVSEKYKGTVMIFTDMTYRKKIEDQLRYLSFHDDLTGLYNRAYFEKEMNKLDSGRFDPVAIIICDIDGLKEVNDTLGHRAGDVLITSTARILQHTFQENDIVARIGGDEFAIAMPSSSVEVMHTACERLRTALSKHNEEKPLVPLSFSIGAAWGTCSDLNIVEIFRKADIEMYKDKADHKVKYLSFFNSMYDLHGNKLYNE